MEVFYDRNNWDGRWRVDNLGLFPQVFKTLRTKSTSDLSASWLIMMTVGVFLWVIYGSYLVSMPIMAANIVTLGCLILLVWVKFTSN